MTRQLPPGPRQLAAGQCIRHAITSVRNNITYAFRISWPWYSVLVPIGIAAGLLVDYVTGGNAEAHPGAAAPIYLILVIINLLAFSSIAVNWHRYILLDEVPQGSELFRLDDKTWRYFGNVLLISLIMVVTSMLIVFPLAFISSFLNAPVVLAFIIVAAVLCLAGILFFRLSVKLPSIALGRRDFPLSHAWAATAANNLPLLFIFLFEIAVVIGALAVMLLALFVVTSISPMLGVVVGVILQLLMNWIFTIFGITILTSLYGFFVENRDF